MSEQASRIEEEAEGQAVLSLMILFYMTLNPNNEMPMIICLKKTKCCQYVCDSVK